MRNYMTAAVASLAVAGGAMAVAGAAQAQTRYYDPYTGRYVYSQPYGYSQPYAYGQPANPYYYSQPYGYTQPYGYNGYGYNGYGSNSGLSAGLAVLGSVLGLNTGGYGQMNVPVDRYGPDPNGMIAPDGHRIKCKLRRNYDSYYRQYVTRRECW